MTVLPESPVREYVERVDRALADRFSDSPYGPSERGQGYVSGIAEARLVVARLAPEPGQETARFEYRVVGADDPERDYGMWRATREEAQSDCEGWVSVDPPFDDLYIERRTVTVIEPVRLDADGEPVS